jgi:hypothetical protein
MSPEQQSIAALALVILAISYLVRRKLKKKKGCGSDCSCGKK